jgi:hypothetical protein
MSGRNKICPANRPSKPLPPPLLLFDSKCFLFLTRINLIQQTLNQNLLLTYHFKVIFTDNAFSQITAECNACTCSFEINLFLVFIVGNFHVLFLLKRIILLFHPQDKLNDVRSTDQDKNVLQKSNSDPQKTE